MRKRTLGRTGIEVGEIGIGCEGFNGKTMEGTQEMVDFCMENGINFFEMFSSDPALRSQVGQALSKYPRSSYVIQGHLCTKWKDGQYSRTRDIAETRESFTNLLSQMKTSYMDIGMIHYCDAIEDWKGICDGPILEYCKELRAGNVIHSIGISTHNPEIVFLAIESGVIDVIMLSVNPAYDMVPSDVDVDRLFEAKTFDRVYQGIDPSRDVMYRRCQNAGVAISVMKPFAGGLLLDPKQTPFGRAMTAAQCISYCLDRPAVASVMAGAKSLEEIRDSLKYETAAPEEKDYSSILSKAPKSSFSGHCMYCGHCAPCASRIDIASVNKFLDLATAENEVRETVKDHYDLLEHRASECIQCGQCERRCPFGVKIQQKMKDAAVLFGN